MIARHEKKLVFITAFIQLISHIEMIRIRPSGWNPGFKLFVLVAIKATLCKDNFDVIKKYVLDNYVLVYTLLMVYDICMSWDNLPKLKSTFYSCHIE